MEEGQTKNDFKPPVTSETVVESEAVVSDASVAPKEPVFKGDRKKMSGGVIACIIILAVLAIGGICFGVWAMLSQNDKIASLETDLANCAASNNSSTENVEVTCPDGTSTEIVKNVITNDLAQNLISPYLKTFGYLKNILDYDFNDDSKIVVAFQNMRPDSMMDYESDNNVVYKFGYNRINESYQKLFGSSKSLEKRDYNPGHTLGFTYSNNMGEIFEVKAFFGGGSGMAMFNVVKSAKYDGNNIVVEVYHDIITPCFEENYNGGYCIDSGTSSVLVDSIDQYNMRDLIEKFADRIPVYTMTFVKDDGHYVLNNIQKQ